MLYQKCCTGECYTGKNVRNIDTGKCSTENDVQKILWRETLYRQCCTGDLVQKLVVQETVVHEMLYREDCTEMLYRKDCTGR